MTILKSLFNAIPAKLGMGLIVVISLVLSGCFGGGSSDGGSLTIEPGSAQVARGAPLNYTATRTYSDGSSADVTSQVTWSSSNTAVATISSAGVATGVTLGNTTITASLGGIVSNTADLQVKAPSPIVITPVAPSAAVGGTASLTASNTNPDGTTGDITNQVTWSSSNNAIATINTSGVVTGVTVGSVTITATLYGVSATTTLTVTPWTLALTPAAATMSTTGVQQFTAARINADGRVSVVTSLATWSSSNTAVATVNSTTGVVTAVAAGSATISATYSGVTSSTALTVAAPTATVDSTMTGTSWAGTWSVVADSTVPNPSNAVLQAALIGNSQSTTASKTVTIASASNVSFYYKVSSEANYDFLRFYIDGVQQTNAFWSGTVAWTLATFPITAGTHTLSWIYAKDATMSVGSDTAWISQVTTTSTSNTVNAVIGAQLGGARQGVAPVLSNAVTTVAGSGVLGFVNGTGTGASFNQPNEITTDGTNLYVVDSQNHAIRKIVMATGVVSTVAGTGVAGFVNNTGTLASFNNPSGIVTDGTNLYVADTGNHAIRKIVIATGVVSTVAGTGSVGFVNNTGALASFSSPYGITTDGANLYVADFGNHAIRQIVIATGVTTTVAGTGVAGFVNATGTLASFNNPGGITTDGVNLYVADYANHAIRQIVIATGATTTVAGTGFAGYANSTLGTSASFRNPGAITTDGTNLYVADTNNHAIRKIVIATGAVTTVAGSSWAGFFNGTGTSATFNQPGGITTDGVSLYVGEYANHAIRKIQ